MPDGDAMPKAKETESHKAEGWREAGWNYYCAFSTYPPAQEAICAARSVAGPRTAYGYARYIAHLHNFTMGKSRAALGAAGVDLFICALAYEIEHEAPPPDTSTETLGSGVELLFDNDDAASIDFKSVEIGWGIFRPVVLMHPRLPTDARRPTDAEAATTAYLAAQLPRILSWLKKDKDDRARDFADAHHANWVQAPQQSRAHISLATAPKTLSTSQEQYALSPRPVRRDRQPSNESWG